MSVPTSTPTCSITAATPPTSSSPPTSTPAPASKPVGAWGSNKSIAATVLANADKPVISARPVTVTSTSHHHVISPESKDMFERGVRIGFDRWDTLNLAVENGWGGRNGIAIKEEFVTQTIAMFLKEKSCPYQDDIEDYLVDGLSEGFHTDAQDDSSNWLSRLLIRLYDDCIVKKDYSGVLKMEAERDKYEEAKTNARANSQIESLTGCESDDDDDEEDGSEDGDEKHADGIEEEGEDDDEDDEEEEEDDMEDEKEEIDEKHGPSSNTTDTQPTTTALDSLHIQSTSTARSTSTSTSTSASTSTSTSTSTSSDSAAMEDDGWTTIPKRGGGRKR